LSLNRALQAAALALAVTCGLTVGAQTTPALADKGRAAQAGRAAASKPRAAAAPKAAAAAPDKPGFNYSFERAPAWVVPAAERPGVPVDPAPMHYRVIDEQWLVEPRSHWQYSHVVRVANDAGGLATASQIEMEFDPSHQTLAVHHLDVVRNGRRISKLDRKHFQLLQRETQLERRMYDGRATLSIVLDDVRAGDEIDYAYSIRGSNPVFGGKFVQSTWMATPRGPVGLYQVRLLAPPERAIQVRGGGPDVQVTQGQAGALRETVFRRESLRQARADEGAPYSAVSRHLLHFSEFADWAEVARWGEALFAPGGDGGPQIDEQVARIRAASADRQAQVLAALQFVQQEVRYFGTEIGASTHRPAAPDQVMQQRFGDCKDKVRLLVALLRRLDVAAVPVLVSTYQRAALEQALPSPLAFDHVIARIDLEGGPYWVDATRSHQSGLLAQRQAYGFGRGLPLAAGTTGLAALPQPFEVERLNVRDIIRVTQFSADPTLESRVTYRGELADWLRESVATRGLQDVATGVAGVYLKMYPKARSVAGPQLERSDQEDTVTLVQRFVLPEFWRFPEQRMLQADLLHWGLIDVMVVPKMETRQDPLALPYAGVYRHSITLEYPEDVYAQPGSQRFDDGDKHLRVQFMTEGDRRRVEYMAELRLRAEQVEAQDWTDYRAKLGKLMPRLGVTIAVPPLSPARAEALGQELKGIGEAVRRGRLKLTTSNQVQAHARAAVLSAQLAGGRLPPPLEAQVRTERGVQYDHLDRLEEARQDFARALELAPDAVETQNAAAVNARLRKDFDRAIELASQVLARQPSDSQALTTRAQAHYFKKDITAARADLEAVLKDRSAVRRGYPLVWLSLALRQAGQDPAGLQAAYPPEDQPSDWPRPLVDLALGRTSPESVITAAKAGKSPAEALCEAYFYIGEQLYAEGNLRRAKEFWRKSVEQGVVEYVEHNAAQWRLATAGGS
jgi:lipoprotein NlpI/transglutaminase-like putative cysteine protease